MEHIPISLFIPQNRRIKVDGYLYKVTDGWELITKKGFLKNKDFEEHNVIYGITHRKDKKYSFIGCFSTFVSADKHVWAINEVCEDEWVKTNNTKDYFGVLFEISYLDQWLPDSLINLAQHSESKRIFEFKNSQKEPFQITKSLRLEISRHLSIKINLRSLSAKETAYVTINSSKKASRKELAIQVLLFKNFFNLFTTKAVHLITFHLLKKNNRSTQSTINFYPTESEKPSNILVKKNEVDDEITPVLTELYRRQNEFSSVLSLFAESFRQNNSQARFLSLVKGLEVYHKTFKEEKNKALLKKLATEVKSNFKSFSTKNVNPAWSFNIRLCHLHQILLEHNDYRENKVLNYDFLDYTYNSRNYYTHFFETNNYVWSIGDLYKHNNKLKLILRILILNELGISKNVISKIIKIEGRLAYIHPYKENEYATFPN